MKKISDKITFIFFLAASICFYVCGIIGIFSKNSFWVVHLCLGSAFLCLSTTYLNKNKEGK